MLARFTDFWAKPYDTDNMDAIDWILLVGLLIMASLFWSTVARHVMAEVE